VNVDPDLQAAYLRTAYWVEARPQPIALRVGERSRALDRVLARQRSGRWAFITAWNPNSRLLAPWRNAARQNELLQALRRAGYRWLPALGDGDDPAWPPEPSVLVLGMSPRNAVRLARRFDQNAVVVGKLRGLRPSRLCRDQEKAP
jgi:hypothetical protein